MKEVKEKVKEEVQEKVKQSQEVKEKFTESATLLMPSCVTQSYGTTMVTTSRE